MGAIRADDLARQANGYGLTMGRKGHASARTDVDDTERHTGISCGPGQDGGNRRDRPPASCQSMNFHIFSLYEH